MTASLFPPAPGGKHFTQFIYSPILHIKTRKYPPVLSLFLTSYICKIIELF